MKTKIIALNIFLLIWITACFADTLEYSENIPEQYTNYFILLSPSGNLNLLKDNISLKGKNKFLMPVLLNGNPVEVFPDARFLHQIPLKKGVNKFLITYITPAGKPINVLKRVNYFGANVEGINQLEKNKFEIIAYLNSSFINPQRPIKSLTEDFTRADLAFFLAKLKDIQAQTVTQSMFKDVNIDFWAAPYIKYATDENLMAEYPDGKFHPEKSVKKLEFLISLITAAKYDLVTANEEIPFKDIKPNHWTAKYIKTALKRQLISVSENNFNPEKDLTFGEFITLAIKTTEVKAALNEIINNKDPLTEKEAAQIQNKIMLSLKKLTPKAKPIPQIPKSKLELTSPINNGIYFSDILAFKGKITPTANFYINQDTFSTAENGDFLVIITANQTINQFTFKANNITKNVTTYYLMPYQDLKGHWLELIAAKCRYLGLTEQTSNFEPKHKITRAEFAHYLSIFFKLKVPTDNANLPKLKDINENTPYYAEINAVLAAGILQGTKQATFLPNKKINKAEAVVALVRYFNLKSDEQEIEQLPYKNIPKQHWIYVPLALAYQQGLISKARSFNYKADLTKAELIGLLAKTPPIKEKLDTFFYK